MPKLKTIFVDLDGTICTQHEHPDFADQPVDYSMAEPIAERIKIINELYDKGHHIDFTELTKDQLIRWGAKYSDLQVGNKPHFDMYICDKSYNAESWFQRMGHGLP